jgi:hypothetical protein
MCELSSDIQVSQLPGMRFVDQNIPLNHKSYQELAGERIQKPSNPQEALL